MKFKLFGIMWDMKIIFGMIWTMIGGGCIGFSFAIDTAPWWAITIWIITTLIFLMTAESVSKKLTDN